MCDVGNVIRENKNKSEHVNITAVFLAVLSLRVVHRWYLLWFRKMLSLVSYPTQCPTVSLPVPVVTSVYTDISTGAC